MSLSVQTTGHKSSTFCRAVIIANRLLLTLLPSKFACFENKRPFSNLLITQIYLTFGVMANILMHLHVRVGIGGPNTEVSIYRSIESIDSQIQKINIPLLSFFEVILLS